MLTKSKERYSLGKKFGRMTIIGDCQRINGETKVTAECECGTIKIVHANSLGTGDTKSCGCLKIENTKITNSIEPFLASKNYLYYHYKRSALDRKIDFNISFQDFINLVTKNCFYCGEKPSNVVSAKTNGRLVYNGIDRVDNSKSYDILNVVTCCKWCNGAKLQKTQKEFHDWIERIYEKTHHSIR